MGVEDKLNNTAENTSGKVKEGVGRATDNERLEAEGRADQTRANVKQAGEKIKDAFRS
ncbi:CsbD family protein [Micromonospora craterilacus]|uniref:CsbD family protein n=1 Tax=Micromonospora craterilacus TaxID=1655439 RepID=A0A2W2ECJ4_9ACTN|nr:CsbD family protein [Micromonospora craterilacus]PZG22036.1 CsbD family protein [Micromonospora craterilacus]